MHYSDELENITLRQIY